MEIGITQPLGSASVAKKISIIAEIAQGFEGRSEQARLLMKAASAAGADAAKYQLVYADELATSDYKYYELFRSLEMADEVWESLATYASELDIQLHLDIFGTRSLQLAERLNVAAIKIHGTDIANIGLLEAVADSSVEMVLLGAGGAYSSEIEQGLKILSNKNVVVLLGFQGYPTPNETNQIARICLLRNRYRQSHFKVSIGFADHAPPESPFHYVLAATAIGAGATVLEKHITLGRVMKFEDFESALNPDEFSKFSQIVHACAEALGSAAENEDFSMSDAEQAYRKMIRRHVVTNRDMGAGSTITYADLVLKRTPAEEVITDLGSVFQKTLKRNVGKNMPISPADIE